MVRARTDRERGAVLLAAAGVLVILALAYFAWFARSQSERRLVNVVAEQQRLSVIDAALARFVAQHRRLPCPARGSLASSALAAGRESTSNGQCVPADQRDGVVPWVTLGLREDEAADGWNGRILYRVQPSLANSLMNLMNMSWCAPGGATGGATGPTTGCNPAPCTGAACMHPNNYLYAKGLQVQDGAGVWLNRSAPPWTGAPAAPPASSGAAYVLVSHGANGAGAYNANGIAQAAPVSPAEQANRNGAPLNGSTIFIDKPAVAAPPPAYFDDLLSHPTLAAVLERAALGPRAH